MKIDPKKQKIITEVGKLKEKLLKLRFQLAVGQLEKTHQIKLVKKEIAQLLTKLNAQGEKL